MKKYYFPKCLLSVHQRPIIFEIINYWKKYIDEVVIVLNRQSGEMIKEYFNKYFNEKIKIKFCYQEKKSGTYFAIKKGMEISKNNDFILNWSDILLEGELPGDINNSIFVTNKISCRWKFENSFIHSFRRMYYFRFWNFWSFYLE